MRRMHFPCLRLCFLLPLLSTAIGHARVGTDYEQHLHWTNRVDIPGTLEHIACTQDYAYVTDQYYGLRVLDLADPDHPVEVGSVALPGQSWDVSLYGSFACVTVYNQGLCVVDVSDPRHPALVGQVRTTSTIGLDVKDGFAYVADYFDSQLYIVSLEDPTNPVIVAESQTIGNGWDVDVVGNMAVVSANTYVVFIDVSDPLNPVRVGRLNLPYGTKGVVADGRYAYLPTASGMLLIVDYGDPAHPQLVANVDVPSVNWSIELKDGFVFVSRQENGLNVYDVRDPAHPVFAGHCPIDGRSWADGMCVLGDRLYLTERYGSMHVIRIKTPGAVLPVGRLALPYPIAQIAIAEPYGYVANGSHGLIVIDVREPSQPSILAQIDSGALSGITAHGGLLYVTGGHQGFAIYDLVNPQQPSLVGSCVLGSAHGTIEIQDGFAYIPAAGKVIDVRDPTMPRVVGTMSSGRDIALQGNLAYVCLGGSILTVDIADPTNPRTLSSISAPFLLHTMTSDQGHLYVGGESTHHPWYTGRIGVLSLDDPIHPSWTAELPMMNMVENLERAGEYVWATQDYQPVAIIDVSDPSVPVVSGMIELAGQMGDITWDIAVGRDFALGACYQLAVLPCNVPARPFSGPPPRSPLLPANPATRTARDAVTLTLEDFEANDQLIGRASVNVHDVAGRIVRKLVAPGSGGDLTLRWDLRDDCGRRVPAGVYFVRGNGRSGIQKVLVFP